MRQLSRLVAAVALVAGSLLLRPPGAVACSCAAPSPGEPHPQTVVEGTAGDEVGGGSSSRAWAFGVEAVERGNPQPGDDIVVNVMTGDEAGCGVDLPPLEPHRRYRIGGSFDVPTATLHLNLCSGPVLEPLGDGEPGTGPDAPAPPPTTIPPAIPPTVVPTAVTPTSLPDTPDSTAVALVAVDEAGSGGVDGRLVATAIGGAAGAGAGAAGLRRLLRRRSPLG